MNENKKNQGEQGVSKDSQRQTEAMEDPRRTQPNRRPGSGRDVADDTGEQGISNRPKMDPDLPDTGGASQGENPDRKSSGNRQGGQRRDN